jgi:hypothetical protein
MKVLTLLIFLIAIFFTAMGNAEIIKDIQMTGMTKTKPWALLRRVNIQIGDDLTPLELADLRIRVAQNSQFILNSFSFVDGVLKIDIEDKWSIIPVPLISQSGEYYMRGVGFFENNFMGRLETLVPAIAYTNSGINFLLLYNSENFFTSNFGISSLIVRLNTLSRFYRHKVEQSHFESRATALEITPNYFYKNMVFKAGPIFFKKDVILNDAAVGQTFEGAGLRSRFNIKNYEPMDVMFKGYFITANSYILRPKTGNGTFLHAKVEYIANYPLLEADFLNFSQNFGLASAKTFFYQFSEGAHEGFRGYDGESLHMQRYSATMFQYQKHVWDRLFAIGFLENTHSVSVNAINNGRHLNEQTIGAGLRYYLKKISIPGINAEYGYNIQDKSSHIHFNVGLKL